MLALTESAMGLAAGDLAAARALAPEAGDAASIMIGAARVAVFESEYERALRLLGDVPAEAPDAQANLAVLEAIVLRRFGRTAEAETAARRARAITGAYGLTTPFLLVPAEDRELFGDGVAWLMPNVSTAASAPRLTDGEQVMLRELVETTGVSVNEIARRLHVSANTVKTQRRTLYRKLGASSREEALAIAVTHGLLRAVSPRRRRK